MTDYLAENGRRTQIIGKIYINNSVQFLGVPAQAWGHGLPFIRNLQAPAEATWWESGNYSNQDCGGSMLDASSIKNVTWGASAEASTDNFPRIPVNPHAAQHCVCDNLLCRRHQERLWSH